MSIVPGNLVIDIQRRHADVFRIRLGDRDDNGYPRKLTDAIRVTSPGRPIVEAFTRVYGGEVQGWTNGGKPEFEAYLPTTTLAVLILPGQSIYQRWETYRKSVCTHRCNGQWDEMEGAACVCDPDIVKRMANKNQCNLMTRISVVCPDVQVLGAGSLVSHGRTAAETLPSAVAIADAALRRGVNVPATLRVIEVKGRNHYVVPRLESVGISVNELPELQPGAANTAGELAPPAPAELTERVERGDVELVTPQASGGGRSAETPPASGDDLAGSAAVPAAPSAASSGDTDLAALVAAVKGYGDSKVNARIGAICRNLDGAVPCNWQQLTPDHLAYVPLVDWLEGLRAEQEAT